MSRKIEAQLIAPEKPNQVWLTQEPSSLAMPSSLMVGEKKPSLTVVKFGGYAMSTSENIQKSAEIVNKDPERNRVVVVAAPGEKPGDKDDYRNHSVTNLLWGVLAARSRGKDFDSQLEAIDSRFHEVGKSLQESSYIDTLLNKLKEDIQGQESPGYIVSRGEAIMMEIFSRISGGRPADAAGFIAVKHGKVLPKSYDLIRKTLPSEATGFDVVGGGYGNNEDEELELFRDVYAPRGTHTAAFLAAALDADLRIFKKKRIFSGDPKLITKTHPISEMTYTELRGMTTFGEDILPRKSILPALKKNRRIEVSSLQHPEEGTKIVPTSKKSEGEIVGVVGSPHRVLYTVDVDGRHREEGTLEKASEVFANEQVSVESVLSETDRMWFEIDKGLLYIPISNSIATLCW